MANGIWYDISVHRRTGEMTSVQHAPITTFTSKAPAKKTFMQKAAYFLEHPDISVSLIKRHDPINPGSGTMLAAKYAKQIGRVELARGWF